MNFSTYLGYTVVVVLVVVAMVCFFSPKDNSLMAGGNNILMGCLFLLYAAFRFYRIRKLSQQRQNNSHENTSH